VGRPVNGGPPSAGGERRPRREYRTSYNRRKPCQFCIDKVKYIDYKDVNRLRRYLSERARIEPRRSTGTCAKHQRRLSTAIKRARQLALLPFTPEQLKTLGFSRPEGFGRGREGGYRGGGRYQRQDSGGYRGGGYRPQSRPAPRTEAPASAAPTDAAGAENQSGGGDTAANPPE